jgi:hypothetical protein
VSERAAERIVSSILSFDAIWSGMHDQEVFEIWEEVFEEAL